MPFSFSLVTDDPKDIPWFREQGVCASVRAGAFEGFPEGRYHSLLHPWETSRRFVVGLASRFDWVVFGPYEDQVTARTMCREVHSLVENPVVGVADETVLMVVPHGSVVALSPRDYLWDHCALLGYRVWLLPCRDPREQWLWYCDLRMRGVNVEHVIVGAWRNSKVLSPATLRWCPARRPAPKLNVFALSIFWGMECERR